MLTDELKQRLRKEIGNFDVFALLELLEFVGLDLDRVTYQGYRGNESQPRILKDIEFMEDGRVVVTFYYGLQGANSPLPSYFFQMVDEGDVNELHFNEFIGFLDQALIRTWLRTMRPEPFNLSYMFRESRRSWLSAMGKFASPQRMKWLLDLVFPELEVRLEKTQFRDGLEARPAVIGHSKIGIEMILGNQFPIMDYRYEITLITDDEYYRRDRQWHSEINDRLDTWIYPLLTPLSLYLEIELVILESRSWLTLSEASNFLGFERLKTGDIDKKVVLIHRGRPPT